MHCPSSWRPSPWRRNGVATSIMPIQPSSGPSGSVAAVATHPVSGNVDAHQVAELEEDPPVGFDLVPAGLGRERPGGAEVGRPERPAPARRQ